MHKIKKGIKKKIKGKKEKNSELFTEEEYEKYKKQKEEESRQREEERAQEDHSTDHSEEEEAEEQKPEIVDEKPGEETSNGAEDWKNFLSATDSVLKSTSVNLEHIKESSYFQVKKREELTDPKLTPVQLEVSPGPLPSSSHQTWVNLDKGGIDDPVYEEGAEECQEQLEKDISNKEPVKEVVLKPIDYLPVVATEDYADIFDTTFVETVESGEVQLFQIPDSPTFDDLNEPDPFDTSEVNKVLHIEEEVESSHLIQVSQPAKKKKRNLVNLDCAVGVLTGKVECSDQSSKTANSEVNLLADFDAEEHKETKEPTQDSEEGEQFEAVHETCVLDEILFGEELDSDLPEIVVPSQYTLVATPDDTEEDKNTTYHDNNLIEEITDILDPLAHTSLDYSNKKASHLDDFITEFDVTEEVETPVAKLPVILKCDDIDENIQDEFDAEFAVLAAESVAKDNEKAIGVLDGDDPFDTTIVDKVLEGDHNTQKPEGTVTVDFAEEYINKQKNKPARPSPPKPVTNNKDPFDTSSVTDVITSDVFDLNENITLPETLQPHTVSEQEQISDNFDPFDTSVAETFGKTELKVLEGELLNDINQANLEDDSDFDFNPREGEESKAIVSSTPENCLISKSDEITDIPVLSPQEVKETEEPDPFDTTFANKIQIKSLEEELLSENKQTCVADISSTLEISSNSFQEDLNTLDSQEHIIQSCLLTSTDNAPVAQVLIPHAVTELEVSDPFDTSIADKVHIKVLEEELLTNCIKSSDLKPENQSALLNNLQIYSFGKESNVIATKEDSSNNRKNNISVNTKPPRPPSPGSILAVTPTDENPVLEPITRAPNLEQVDDVVDPFDTSIADKFSRTELKVLESELLTSNTTTEIDNDFDPRAESPVRPPPPKPPNAPPRPKSPILPIRPTCLLTDNAEDVKQKLSPLSPAKLEELSQEQEIDPFDTSFASTFGKTEIKNLENELLSDLRDSSKNSAFVSNSYIPQVQEAGFNPTLSSAADFIVCDHNKISSYTHSSNLQEISTVKDIDPFDTTIAHPIVGSIEYLSGEKYTNSKDILFDISPSIDKQPVLQPTLESNPVESAEEVDPFDTSIASNLGQIELRVLEGELLSNSSKKEISDDDFDPRK